MPRGLKETGQFKVDKKKIKRSGRHDWEKMRTVVRELMNDRPLAARQRDHALAGDYGAGVRECHIEPDWLLIYNRVGELNEGSLVLIRTGSHSELF